MSKIDYQALREAAEQATKGSYIVGHTSGNQHGNITGVFVCQKWKGEPGGVIAECHVNCLVETDVQAYANAEFIAAFNPNVALALLDERDALNERLAELEADLAGLAEDHQKATESIKQADAAVKLAHEKFSALAAENAGLKDTLSAVIDRSNEPDYQSIGMGCGVEDNGLQTDGYNACEYGWREAMDRIYSEVIPDTIPETPATDAFLAEVRAHDLNAFIRHHSAELDAHIKNGGEQFDEKSVRIRDIIVSVRLFREQIRKGAAL